jgi:hypothetical protein
MKSDVVWLDTTLIISPVYYCLCKNKKTFKKALKYLNIKKKDRPDFLKNEWSHATVHYFENDGKTTAIVCIGNCDNRTPSEIIGLLIHEAVHIWQEVKYKLGENNPSKEFEAYSIQCIAQRLIEAYG